MRSSVLYAVLLMLAACRPVATEPQKPSISYKTRVDNASARVDKTYRLSESETVKVIIVPGHPIGDRCVVYTNGQTSTMQCRELLPSQQ